MSLPAVLIRVSTGEVIKHDKYPVADMSVVQGLDSDLKWLIKRELVTRPNFDQRLFQLVITEDITEIEDTEYSHLDQYQIGYTVQKKLDVDITASIINEEKLANEGVFPSKKQLKILLLGLGVLFRVNQESLTAKEQLISDMIIAMATKVWDNDTNMKIKVQEVADSVEPDLDEGWETE